MRFSDEVAVIDTFEGGGTTRERLAALLAAEPTATDSALAGRLGVSRERVAQLRGRRAVAGPPPMALAGMGDVDLLRAVWSASGLGLARFAAEVLVRDLRTVRRYLSGVQEMSGVVRGRLVLEWERQAAVAAKLARRAKREVRESSE